MNAPPGRVPQSGAPPGAGPDAVEEGGADAAYRILVRLHTDLRDRASRRSTVLATARGLTFLAGAGALVAWDVLEGPMEAVALTAAGLLAAAFVLLVGRHRAARALEARHGTLRSVAAEGLLRLARDWEALEKALPEHEARPDAPPADHPWARDLLVDGRASLRRLTGPVTSETGRRIVRGWLLAAADPDTVRARQEAVRELAADLGFRMELTARGRRAEPGSPGDLDALLAWAASGPVLLDDRAARGAAWVLPPLTLTLGGLHFFGVLPAAWLLPLLLQLWVLRRAARRLEGGLARAARGAPALRSHGPQLRLVEEAERRSGLLRELAVRLDVGDRPAHERLDRLGRLVDMAESRRNLVYQALNPVLLLDVHLGVALDRWREGSGDHVAGWLEALGEVEALSALACLAHDHPDWTFPSWSADGAEPVVRGRALGHPLLLPSACVRNDVEVGPPGTFLLVTGSNMSGKSTLLRALGANVVLAGAGGPVCAEALDLPAVRLHTSMTVTDSLEEGVSRFMAELLRVRSIVEAARAGGVHDPPVLYLLDEMLQGTNTAERRVAARAVLGHLLDEGAIGAVTTHDLTLHRSPGLMERARAFHFRETVEHEGDETRLHFDYRLLPGLATTRNALELLRAVGLGVEPGGEGEPEGGGALDRQRS